MNKLPINQKPMYNDRIKISEYTHDYAVILYFTLMTCSVSRNNNISHTKDSSNFVRCDHRRQISSSAVSLKTHTRACYNNYLRCRVKR